MIARRESTGRCKKRIKMPAEKIPPQRTRRAQRDLKGKNLEYSHAARSYCTKP
jgi:hypothetical protein